MDNEATLATKAFAGLAQLMIILTAMVFLPQWSVEDWRGWLFLAVFGLSAAMLTLFFLNADPALISRRLRTGPTAEHRPMQKRIQALTNLLFLGLILLPGFDHRFGWSDLSASAALAGNALIVLGFLVIFFVFRTNSFAGAIIETVADQRVIENGPYSIVRHPMYSGALFLIVGIPLALGSAITLVLCLPMAMVLAWRAADEERCLLAELAGYAEYRRRVRWRLVPGIY